MPLLPGPPGWCEETEALVLARLNRNDKHLLRCVSKLTRSAVGRLFTKLLLVDADTIGYALPSVDLGATFPNKTSIAFISYETGEGWLERWYSFMSRNSCELQRLEALGICEVATISASSIIEAILTLSHLQQLTKLEMSVAEFPARVCGPLAAALPRLQHLDLDTQGERAMAAPEDTSSLASLTSLHTLSLADLNTSSSVLQALANAAAITTLSLGTNSKVEGYSSSCMLAVGNMTQLKALELNFGVAGMSGVWVDISPLASLQGLTSLKLGAYPEAAAGAAVLCALPALLRLGIDVSCAAMLVHLAGRQLESLKLLLDQRSGAQVVAAGPPLQAPLRCTRLWLDVWDSVILCSSISGSWFDLAGLRRLEVVVVYLKDAGSVQQLLLDALPCCSGLRALSLDLMEGGEVLAQLLAAAGVLQQLQQLRRRGRGLLGRRGCAGTALPPGRLPAAAAADPGQGQARDCRAGGQPDGCAAQASTAAAAAVPRRVQPGGVPGPAGAETAARAAGGCVGSGRLTQVKWLADQWWQEWDQGLRVYA